jgi:hypothetical protein
LVLELFRRSWTTNVCICSRYSFLHPYNDQCPLSLQQLFWLSLLPLSDSGMRTIISAEVRF